VKYSVRNVAPGTGHGSAVDLGEIGAQAPTSSQASQLLMSGGPIGNPARTTFHLPRQAAYRRSLTYEIRHAVGSGDHLVCGGEAIEHLLIPANMLGGARFEIGEKAVIA